MSQAQPGTNSHNSGSHVPRCFFFLFFFVFKCMLFPLWSSLSATSKRPRPRPQRTPPVRRRAQFKRPQRAAPKGLTTHTRCRCWPRYPGWRLPFLGAPSPCCSRWPPGCPGGGGSLATGGRDGGAPDGGRQVSCQRAWGTDPAAAWVEEDTREMRVRLHNGGFLFQQCLFLLVGWSISCWKDLRTDDFNCFLGKMYQNLYVIFGIHDYQWRVDHCWVFHPLFYLRNVSGKLRNLYSSISVWTY